MLQRLTNYLPKVIASGFILVFLATIFSQLVAFSGAIIYVRLLGPHAFGLYSFSYNIISFFLLLNGFGAASGILQFVSQTNNKALQLSYLKYSIGLGIMFNALLSIAIVVYALFLPLPLAGSRKILLAMAFFPLGRLYIDVMQAFLRATQQNQLLAKFAISSNLILLLVNIIGVYYYGLLGLIITTYLGYLLIILIATFIYHLPNILTINLGAINKKKFVNYSLYASIGNAFAQLIYLLDILILGYLVKDAKIVGAYKVATIIPFALNFIPGVISSFFYPYFAKNASDLAYIKQLKQKVQQGMLIFSGVISLGLIILAKPLIVLIFGISYIKSILPFQILMFGFWIVATFRIINGNILASLGKAKFAMWLNIFIVGLNILVTYTLVLHYGIIGAAMGVVIIYCVASLIASWVLRKLLK